MRTLQLGVGWGGVGGFFLPEGREVDLLELSVWPPGSAAVVCGAESAADCDPGSRRGRGAVPACWIGWSRLQIGV